MYHSIVTVETRKKSTNMPQCHRCQRFGHTKNYCTLPPRCVKCAGNHSHTECNKLNKEKPKCVNCGGEHAASYRGCSHHIELQQKRMINKPHLNNPIVNPAQTYANRVRNVLNTNSIPSNLTTLPSEQSQSASLIKTLLELITPYLPLIKEFIINSILPLLFNGP